LILLTSQDLSQNSPHDLTTSRLGQIWNNEDGLGCCEWTNALSDLQDEILLQLVVDLVAVLDGNESIDCLASKLIVDSNDCGFCYSIVLDKCGFDFGSRKTVTADIDDVVDTASDPVVAFVVTSSPITSELTIISKWIQSNERTLTNVVSLVDIQVCIHISLVCTPDRSSHTRPWLLESQNTLDVVSVNLLARHWIDDRRLDTKEWKGCGSWLSWSDTSEWSDDVGTSLGLPVSLGFVSNHSSIRKSAQGSLTSTT
jgi:hypothetical protein